MFESHHLRLSGLVITASISLHVPKLIANGLDVEEIRRSIGADSLGYVSLEGLIAATEVASERLCSACFTGEYPIQHPRGFV
jgi:glutamine phosphoribosylpyrophosphate amidotransferase